MRSACGNCPWRVDAPREHWDPTHFIDIWHNCQDDGTRMMLCHKTGHQPDAPKIICQGWLRVMKTDAIGVRLALMRDLVTVAEMEDETGPTLFGSFAAMLKANGIGIPPRNRSR